MKLPNHYGSISKLSGNRRRPYIIRKSGASGRCIIIGYAKSREEGLAMLAAYNADPWDVDKAKMTLQELFDLWKKKKAPRLGTANRACLLSAFRYCAVLGAQPYRQIKAYQMQDTIDSCGKSYSTQSIIKNLWGHLDKFALELDITSKGYAALLTSDSVPPTSREVFTAEEVARLWEHEAEPWVDTVLIFLYSGWRISELLALRLEDIDLKAGTMQGGTKTKAGKGRIIPIHSRIQPFIESRLAQGGPRLICREGKPVSLTLYRGYWSDIMRRLGMSHVPHECRHTFETRLDAAGGNRKCIDLLMGHVSKDTGNRVYNHKTIEELSATIELISI